MSEPSAWDAEIEEGARRRDLAAGLGGPDRVVRQHANGKLTVRERIARLADPGSFREVGGLAGEAVYDDYGTLLSFTPAPFVFGEARIDGRRVTVGGDDFTVKGAASARGPNKRRYFWRMSHDLQIPQIKLLDGAGASVKAVEEEERTYVPEIDGWSYAAANLSRVPVVAAALGPVAGLPAAEVVASHFSVMVKGLAQVFAAGPPVVARSGLGPEMTKEELGGWEVAARSGVVDNAAEDEEDAFRQIREFLDFLPGSRFAFPQVRAATDPADRDCRVLRDAVPRNPREPVRIRPIIHTLVDDGRFFEIGRYYGRSAVVGLARLQGAPVAVIATDPFFDGGGLTADASSKLTRFVDMANLFRLPVIHLVDRPGVVIGPAAERAGSLRYAARMLAALHEATVPWATILIRRAFGLAGAADRDHSRHGFRVAWPSGTWGSLPIEGGVKAAYKRAIEAAPDPELYLKQLEARLTALRSPYRTAEAFLVEDVIDPADSRALLCDWVGSAYDVLTSGALDDAGARYRP
ncbi:methylmalonyl-CoA carboxyltransferase [Pseudonocardia sp. RS11V-5]|uniref:acyl-CoA carboxylase subunit beta n=1 Tax=Pseudonocardia terrae TaxID=2905831 RepID=UPI001E588EA2|nr:carboxyl transferase domain-containing protein [Pseudonocardia terrae]MCE3550882.1 methylmalonyl-CoA carboxyltransferase [Pseudonocardia terrae]